MEAAEPRPRRNAAVVAEVAMKEGERIVEQPPEQKKKKPRRKISFDIGPVPLELRSVLKKPSPSQKLAKKVKLKYKSRGRVRFHQNCRIAVISPLPGWSGTKLRLPESDEEEEDPETGIKITKKKANGEQPRLRTHLEITPMSMRKLEAPEVDANQLHFNARMIFGDEGESSKELKEEEKQKRRAKKARRVTIAKLEPLGPLDDSPEPHRPASPGAIARAASLADCNLEDSASQATSVEEVVEESKPSVALEEVVTVEVRRRKAARAEAWLNDDSAFAERSHDSTLEREQELFEVAAATMKGKKGSSSSERLDGDADSDVVVELPLLKPRSRRSMGPKAERRKPAGKDAVVEPPPVPKSASPSENVAPKEAVNPFFLPRNINKKTTSEDTSKESKESGGEKKNRRRSVFIKDAVEPKAPPAPIAASTEQKSKNSRRKSFFVKAEPDVQPTTAPIEPPTDAKPKNSRRKSFFVKTEPETVVIADELKTGDSNSDEKKPRSSSRRKSFFAPKEPVVAKQPEPVDDVEILEPSTAPVVKPRPQKRKSMYVPAKAKKAAISTEDEERDSMEKEEKRWKRAVNWNELDYAPVAKFNASGPIRIVEETDIENLPSPSYRIRLPPMGLVSPLTAPFPIEPKEDPLPRITFTVLSNTDDVEKSLDDREKEWIAWLRRDCDDSQPWSEAFCPKESGKWFGDAVVATEAKKFVAKWRKRVLREEKAEEKKKTKKRRGYDSDDSDYEDEGPGEYENPLILCGPTGCGKTALISALVSELNMKILEVQPGERRNGAALRQKLAEAGQSHMMPSGPSIASFFGGPKPSTTAPAQPKERQQTLIVVEHVDIHFDEDKEFWPALKTLAAEAKVPVIWTCELFPSSELHREPMLASYARIDIGYSPVRSIARYVKCCALASRNIDISLEDVERLVLAHNSDLRSILVNLQIQLASPEDNFIEFPAQRSLEVAANVTEGTSGYSSRQEQLEEKRMQYREIVTEVEGIRRADGAKMNSRLVTAREAMNTTMLTRHLALDTMPFLMKMDAAEVERQRNQGRRRFQHYFNAVSGEIGSIDTNGLLLPEVKFFSFPPPV